MKNILLVFLLLAALAENALAVSGYDACVKEEKELKEQEKSRCSGLSNLLNPSGCYATQKLLKDYKAGKCRQIGVAENVDFSAQPVVAEKKVVRPAFAGSTASPRHEGNLPVTGTQGSAAAQKTDVETAHQVATLDQLKEENARLRSEVERLKAEVGRLKKQ